PYQENHAEHQNRDLRVAPTTAQNPAQDVGSIADGFRAKENPGQANKAKYSKLFTELRNPFAINCGMLQFARHQNPQAMQGAPDHKRPGRAMPNPGNEKGKKQVAIRLPGTTAIAAEWDINIIPKPTGKTDVPARPEVTQARRQVRIIEVQDEIKSE